MKVIPQFTSLLVTAVLHGVMLGQIVAGSRPAPATPPFMAGVDVSEMLKLQNHGAAYKFDGIVQDPYSIFHAAGINWMRIRLFVNPSGVGPLCNDLPYSLQMAKEIKAHGFRLLLDFHYSDGWADPSKQLVPKAWEQLDHARLVKQVEKYTRSTIQAFADAHALPDMVEVGNEITNGMIWPDGRVTPETKDAVQWEHLADLLNAGIGGVQAASPSDHRPLILIHIDRGGDKESSRLFFDHLVAAHVPFDVIGLSDYPWWQGTLPQLKANLDELALAYHKPIIVAETAFPWSEQKIGLEGKDLSGDETVRQILHFQPTPQGQAEYLRKMIQTVRSTPEGLGTGVFYWAAAWVKANNWDAPEWSEDWEKRALFDADGNALPAMKVLGNAAREGVLKSSSSSKSASQ